ncbi:MAG: hypothetical protein LUH21_04555 [Clostridiales bacterium]|nr:hypothetical protein [Clostridiales bacterium]
MTFWENKDDDYLLHVDGYKDLHGENVIVDMSYILEKNLVMYESFFLQPKLGEFVAQSIESAKGIVEKMVKETATKEMNYYKNIILQLEKEN